jgi:hypothetical protein
VGAKRPFSAWTKDPSAAAREALGGARARLAVDERIGDGEQGLGQELAGHRVARGHAQRGDRELTAAAHHRCHVLIDDHGAVRQTDRLVRRARDRDGLTVDDETGELRAAREHRPRGAAGRAPGHQEVGRDLVARDGQVHVGQRGLGIGRVEADGGAVDCPGR